MLLLGLSVAACASEPSEPPSGSSLTAPLADPVQYVEIESALEAGNLIQAKNLLERAALARQKGPRYELLLAEYHLANGSTAMAGAEFGRIKDIEDVAARAHQGLGLSLIQSGDFDGALETLLTATQLDASLWRSWNALGVIYDREADYGKAADAYERAIVLQPKRSEIVNNLGFSHLLNGDLETAIDYFSEALRLRSSLDIARTNLRLAMALKGDYVAALAGSGSQDLRSLLNNAGVAALTRGDYLNAEALLTRAMEKSPSFYALAAKNLEMLQALKETQGMPE